MLSEFIYTKVLKPAPLRAISNIALKTISRSSVSIGGARVVLNPDDPVISGALTLGVYENDEIAFVRKTVKPGDKVLDIGANVGLYTALCGVLAGRQGQVIAVEPDPTNLKFLQQTVAANAALKDRAIIVPAAAGAKAGAAALFQSADNKGDHRLYDNAMASVSINVDMVRLDDTVTASGIDTLDFIKIDVQGYEHQALLGLAETLARSDDVILMTEFWPEGLAAADSSGHAFMDWLRGFGFTLYRLEKHGNVSLITDDKAFIDSLPGRKYANIVARKQA